MNSPIPMGKSRFGRHGGEPVPRGEPARAVRPPGAHPLAPQPARPAGAVAVEADTPRLLAAGPPPPPVLSTEKDRRS